LFSEEHTSFAEPNVLKEHAAARYVGLSVSGLRRRRAAHRPPDFVQLDRSIGYRKSALDRFLDEHTVAGEEPEDDSSDRIVKPRRKKVQ
jgi:hypothetical protein